MLLVCNSICTHETTALDIMIHPEDHNTIYENEVAFSVSASGPGILSYQWMKDGEAIIGDGYIGANLPTLHISNFTMEHEGQYVCVVSRQNCSLMSKPGNLKGTGTFFF